MQTKECPCCGESFTFKNFYKQLFSTKKRNPFTKEEPSMTCTQCDKSILSAERKNQKLMPTMAISMIPFLIIAFNREDFLSIDHLITSVLVFMVSFTFFILGLYRMYVKIEFICDDKNSRKYNEDMIHS